MPICLALVVITATPALSSRSKDEAEKIAKLKAAFLLNFMKFSEWPEDSFKDDDSPILLTVYGADTIGTALDQTLTDRAVHGRTIVIHRALPPVRNHYKKPEEYRAALSATMDRLRQSHVVLLAGLEEESTQHLINSVADAPVLLVGDGQQYVKSQTMLDLVKNEGRIRIYANREALEESQVKVSSRLLKLAVLVGEK
ncbi:MAG: YfiR family protein [Desulfobacterales bacterium]|nr:YfiR family protein [Desulfobacterales bacterium]